VTAHSTHTELTAPPRPTVMGCCALLRRDALRLKCELAVLSQMTNYTNFTAVARYASQIANTLGDRQILMYCYGFLKRIGVEKWVERGEGTRSGPEQTN